MGDEHLTPPDSAEAHAFARENPGGWLYEVDPFFDPDENVPPYGIVGAWSISSRGEITDKFKKNPRYRPSPVVLGFPEPTDPLDAAIQLAASGYGDRTRPITL